MLKFTFSNFFVKLRQYRFGLIGLFVSICASILLGFVLFFEPHQKFAMVLMGFGLFAIFFLLRFIFLTTSQAEENEEKLTFLTEVTSEGIVVHENGVILEANPAAEKLLGATKGEIIGKNVLDFTFLGDRERILQNIKDRRSTPFEARAVTLNGQVFDVELLGRVLTYRGKKVMVTTIRDMSFRKKSESQRELLEMIPKISSEGFWLLDENLQTVDVNESLCNMLGYSREEMIGKKPIEFATEEGVEALKKSTSLIRSTDHRKYETSLKHKSGKIVYTIFTATTIRNQKGDAINSFAFVTNITENKKNELKVAKLNRLYSILYKTNEAILRIRDVNALLDFICNIVTYEGLFKMVWVGVLNQEKTLLLPISSAGQIEGYLDHLQVPLSENLEGCSPAGSAIRERSSNYSNDIENDSSMIPWASEALKRGFRSVAAIPIFLDGEPYGAINFYSKESHFFNLEIITQLETLARDLSFAIKSSEMEKARKITEEALRKSEERYSLSALAANDGLWDWNLETGEVYFSSRWKSMIGFRDSEIGNSMEECLNRVHPDDIEKFKEDIKTHLHGESTLLYNEYRILQKDGTYKWVLTRGVAQWKDNKAFRVVGSQSDIHSRKIAEEKLSHDALYDHLTGLPNRNFILDKLNSCLEKTKSYTGYSFAVLFLDLDRFKNINDSLGHLSGDKLLKEAGERFLRSLRNSDTIGRLGGDEFIVILEPAESIKEIQNCIEKLFQELVDPFILGSHDFFVTASIGVALGSPEYENSEQLLRDADIAMYRAKESGKNTFQIFQKEMTTRLLEHVSMETNLRKALKRKEFVLHYQPKISLKEKKITGFEALIRWNSPDSGLVPPNDFIPLAEETGLIVPIGEWVVREACLQIQKWERAGFGKMNISVNYSAKNFKQKNTCTLIQDALGEFGLPPDLLDIELTESSVMENPEFTVKVLQNLKEIGVTISIDDFGTGYSSLNYLKRFPIDILKIDKTFTQDIMTNANDAAITTAIIALSHILKLRVIAEGVETKEQLDFLYQNSCDLIQGYYFSPPIPAEDTDTFIANFEFPVDMVK